MHFKSHGIKSGGEMPITKTSEDVSEQQAQPSSIESTFLRYEKRGAGPGNSFE